MVIQFGRVVIRYLKIIRKQKYWRWCGNVLIISCLTILASLSSASQSRVKYTQKWFSIENWLFSRTTSHLKIKLLLRNDLILQTLICPVQFRNLIASTAVIWERITSEPPKEGSQYLTLVIFGISNLRQRLVCKLYNISPVFIVIYDSFLLMY